jgi:glycerate dehydrogenase
MAKRNHEPHVVWLDKATLPGEIRRPSYPHRWSEYASTDDAFISERLAAASVVVTNKVPINAQHLRQAKRLRRIVVAATGTDHIDLKACISYGVDVINVPAYGVESVAEHALCLMLALNRQLSFYANAVTQGLWTNSPVFCLHGPSIADLYGKTLVIVGAGAIGKGVAQLGKAFGMRVIFAARRGRMPEQGQVAFGDAIAMADVLSLHLPLNDETHHLIGSSQLQAMKRSAVLVNTARGGLIDSEALAQVLRDKRIAGAALDVLDEEPPRQSHPLLAKDIPNLLITPHIAWASQLALRRLSFAVSEGINQFSNMETL